MKRIIGTRNLINTKTLGTVHTHTHQTVERFKFVNYRNRHIKN